MTDECRPPAGTPDGTVCVLRRRAFYWNGPSEIWIVAVWGDGWWHFGEGQFRSPTEAARDGYSIAEPPADG
jgi:hypothetical protein